MLLRPGLLLVMFLAAGVGADPVVYQGLNSGSVTVRLVDVDGPRAVIEGRFVPPSGFHLYSKDLPETGIAGVGRPTRLDLPPDSPLSATGPVTADVREHALVSGDASYPVYPDGPVILRLPVLLPRGDGAPKTVTVVLGFMACSDSQCLVPESQVPVELSVPSHPEGGTPAVVATVDQDLPQLVLAVPATRLPAQQTGPGNLSWYTPEDLGQVKALLDQAAVDGTSVLLDFTGPSCQKCGAVAKDILPLPTVRDALQRLERVEMNTDAHGDLGRWQLRTFGTGARPFFVRVDPDGRYVTWDAPLLAGDVAGMETFTAFIAGGSGSFLAGWSSFWQLILMAVLGGLAALLMPCTYPMIPFTVGFFTKQADEGRRLMPLAGAYAAGIVLSFVAIGLLVALLLGGAVGEFAGGATVNLVIGLLFVLLGLSLLGAFFLRLPAWLGGNLASGSRGGYLGALIMGLTFAVAAFTCTAPFVGLVLGKAVADGTWWSSILGMAVFSGVIAVPFFVLALMPGLLKRLPDAGAWMNEFKVVGGLVQIAAALRFLAVADHAWGIGLIDRDLSIAVWAALAIIAGLYVLGLIRLHDDGKVERVGLVRLFVATAAFAFAITMAAGLAGADLGAIDTFFPM